MAFGNRRPNNMRHGRGRQEAPLPPAWFDATDPFVVAEMLWPDREFYGRQVEVVESVRNNDETYVPAGNMLGKDWIAGFISVVEFLTAGGLGINTVARVVTTSVKDDHLRVLWGEINDFVQNSRIPLTHDKGGPLLVNHRDIRKGWHTKSGFKLCPKSYLRGMVSEKGEGLAGHHAPYTLLVGDEASGLDDLVYTQGATWARRMLFIGNPNPCANFFKRAIKAGDLLAK